MLSTSGAMLGSVSAFRNPTVDNRHYHLGKVAVAQIAYIAIVPYAIVEAAISQVAKAVAHCVNVDSNKYQSIQKWAESSAYCMLWAIYAAGVNLFAHEMIASETQFIDAMPRKKKELELAVVDLYLPPAIEPAVADILRDYELADNAKKFSDVQEQIYRELPQPTLEELNTIGNDIAHLLEDRCSFSDRNWMKQELNKIAHNEQRSLHDDRYIKMMISIRRKMANTEDPSRLEIIKQGLKDACENCNTRKNAEIQQLFFQCVVPGLNSEYLNSLTPLETLIFEMMQYRMQLRDKIIRKVFNDPHYLNIFYRKFNESIFYLPRTDLTPEFNFEGEVLRIAERLVACTLTKTQESPIIQTFQKCYESPNTIYTVFKGLLYPRQGEAFKFKPEMFVNWLQANELMNTDAFENEEMTAYKPLLIVRFLVEMGFLKRKI